MDQTASHHQSDLPDQSPHYVQAVTEMGEEREILAHEDIYAANGMKLLAKGARIDGSQRERLNLHKLRMPLDFVLSTAEAVDGAQLAMEAGKLLASDPMVSGMAERSGDPLGCKQALGALSLPAPLRFRLTVMREKRPALFLHSLRVALITYSVAVRLKMSHREKHDLLLAALCHDLGEMHTDPVLLEPEHRISSRERGYIHVHPITSYVLLKEISGLPAATLEAVLQHHERLDGGGYPYGLSGDAISPLARLLCVAEVMEGIGRRTSLRRLDVLLRLNQRRLDQKVVKAVRELLQADMSSTPAEAIETDPLVQLTHLEEVLRHWQSLKLQLDGPSSHAVELGFLKDRMAMLRSLVLQAGINPGDFAELLNIARGETALFQELQATLNELEWLMSDIANEIERRVDLLTGRNHAAMEEFIHTLRPQPTDAETEITDEDSRASVAIEE